MSYILEALRKSERQRREAEAQPLARLAAYPADTPRARWRPVLLTIFAILNLGVLAVVLRYALERGNSVDRAAAPAPAPAEQAMASRAAAAALSADKSEPASEPLGFAEAPLSRKPATGRREPAGPGRPKKPRESASPPRSAVPPHRPAQAAPPDRSRRVRNTPDEASAAHDAVPEGHTPGRPRRVDPVPATPNTAVRRSAIPRAGESLPGAAFDEHLPRPKINVYAYSPTTERDRFVVIGGRKYHEGERLDDGPAIRRIEESAVTLDFEGQTYKVPRP